MTYVSQASDKSPAADRYQMAILRQKTPAQRYAIAAGLIRMGKRVSLQQHRRRSGTTGDRLFADLLVRGNCMSLKGPAENWIQDPLEIAKILHEIMTALQIDYFVSGGVASLVYGEPRTTMDLDVVAQIKRDDLTRVVTRLELEGFYCPAGAVEEIQKEIGRTLNITHTLTALSADISVMRHTDHAQSEMARRQLMDMGNDVKIWFCAPEDLILAKLQWRAQSEKQQRDILAVMKVQEGLLDLDYLRSWAQQLGLSEWVETLLKQASTSEVDTPDLTG